MLIKNYQNIAIIETAFLGDIALSLFLPALIKSCHPNVKIHFVTLPKAKSLVENCRAIDNFIAFDKHNTNKGIGGILEISKQLKAKLVDLIIAPHRSAKTSILAWLSKPKFSIGFRNSALGFLYKKTVPYKPYLHQIDRNFELLKIFVDIEFRQHLPKVQFDFSKINSNNFSFLNNPTKTISIAPGSVWKTKQWKLNHYTELCKKFISQDFQVVLLGGTEDSAICNEIQTLTGAINLAGKTSLIETLFILTKSELLITNDSSPTHFATLVDCPCITIFGPTSPNFGFTPRSTKNKVIYSKTDCSPCSLHGYNTCPLGHHKCMENISPEVVFNEALELIGS